VFRRQLLFHLISRIYGRTSNLVSTNRAYVFGGAKMTTALLDRLPPSLRDRRDRQRKLAIQEPALPQMQQFAARSAKRVPGERAEWLI
jgi:hypothetical protein